MEKGKTGQAGTDLKRYAVVTDPNTEELFRIHDAGCADLRKREAPLYRQGIVSSIIEVEAETAEKALDAEMRSDFSGRGEHPEANGYPEGSYGAAGFSGRILPCCKKAQVVR